MWDFYYSSALCCGNVIFIRCLSAGDKGQKPWRMLAYFEDGRRVSPQEIELPASRSPRRRPRRRWCGFVMYAQILNTRLHAAPHADGVQVGTRDRRVDGAQGSSEVGGEARPGKVPAAVGDVTAGARTFVRRSHAEEREAHVATVAGDIVTPPFLRTRRTTYDRRAAPAPTL